MEWRCSSTDQDWGLEGAGSEGRVISSSEDASRLEVRYELIYVSRSFEMLAKSRVHVFLWLAGFYLWGYRVTYLVTRLIAHLVTHACSEW